MRGAIHIHRVHTFASPSDFAPNAAACKDNVVNPMRSVLFLFMAFFVLMPDTFFLTIPNRVFPPAVLSSNRSLSIHSIRRT